MLKQLDDKSELVKRFSTLVRKIWNPSAFKGQVSPHELLQVNDGRFFFGIWFSLPQTHPICDLLRQSVTNDNIFYRKSQTPVTASSSWQNRVIHWRSFLGSWMRCTGILAAQRRETAASFTKHSKANSPSKVSPLTQRPRKEEISPSTLAQVWFIDLRSLLPLSWTHFDTVFYFANCFQ